jgi:hypothetical protein
VTLNGTASCVVAVGLGGGTANQGISGVSVTLTGHTTGYPLGVVTSNSAGYWNFTGSMPTTETSVDIAWSQTRYNGITKNTTIDFGSVAITCGGNFGPFNVTMTAQTGYACLYQSNLPVKLPLSASDTLLGAFTFPASGQVFSSNSKNVNTNAGPGPCAAAVNVPVYVNLYAADASFPSGTLVYPAEVRYLSNTTTGCPESAGTPLAGDSSAPFTYNAGSSTPAPGFQLVGTWQLPYFGNNSVNTLTITEAP